jgi:cytochrome c-type biogenesis protein
MRDTQLLKRSITNTLVFILGFSAVFVMLGAGAGSISMFIQRHIRLITTTGAAIVILLSLQVMGVFSIPFLNFEKKAMMRRKPRGVLGSFVIGITFAAAWSPCIGPILSSILILAATGETAMRGVVLLSAYSIGLGVPFLFAAIAFSSFLSFSDFLKKHFKTIKLVSGLLLLAVGIALVLGQFRRLSQYLAFVPDITLIESNNLSVFVALLAGFISFISPCVLPLIPSYLTFITGTSVLDVSSGKETGQSAA